MHNLHPIRWLRDLADEYRAISAEFDRLKAEGDTTPTIPAASITYHPATLHDPEIVTDPQGRADEGRW